ncbi:MAG: HAD family hydrolase [Janthinobacterium lividum]
MPVEALALPVGNFRAYLFDLDGTVADTMPQHFVAWTAALAARGAAMSEELFYQLGGVPPLRVAELLNERFGYMLDPVSLVADKEARFLSGVADIKPIASVLAHIVEAHGRIPLAIVSGSPRDNVERTLAAMGLTDRFAITVCAEDYTQGKPHPEPFLKAAMMLGVAPVDCLVFEDADAGIASAEAAGMQWVRVPQTVPAQQV